MPLWNIDYFQLKLLEKQPMQEGHFNSPLSCGMQDINPDPPTLQGSLPVSEV